MAGDLPDYYFRVRENGAFVFRVDTENRQRRIDMDQIATVNIRKGEIKPHEGSTSYIKLSGVQTDKAAPPINMIVKNTTEYFPAWPKLGNCLDKNCKDFERDEADGESLKPAGFLNNGRKSGWDKTDDLIQVNLCNKRFLNLKVSFVDDDDKDITLMQSTMRFFDIDHGNPENHGPEVMQFKCA